MKAEAEQVALVAGEEKELALCSTQLAHGTVQIGDQTLGRLQEGVWLKSSLQTFSNQTHCITCLVL